MVWSQKLIFKRSEGFVILLINNIIDRTCAKWWNFKKNKNCKETLDSNHKETVEIFQIQNEERRPKKINTHRAYHIKENQKRSASNLLNMFEQMVAWKHTPMPKMGFRKDKLLLETRKDRKFCQMFCKDMAHRPTILERLTWHQFLFSFFSHLA